MKKKKTLLLIGRILMLAFFLLLVILPIYWMFITSLKAPADIATLDIQYWPKNLTWDNYKNVLAGSNFLLYLKNSTIVAPSLPQSFFWLRSRVGTGFPDTATKGKDSRWWHF